MRFPVGTSQRLCCVAQVGVVRSAACGLHLFSVRQFGVKLSHVHLQPLASTQALWQVLAVPLATPLLEGKWGGRWDFPGPRLIQCC